MPLDPPRRQSPMRHDRAGRARALRPNVSARPIDENYLISFPAQRLWRPTFEIYFTQKSSLYPRSSILCRLILSPPNLLSEFPLPTANLIALIFHRRGGLFQDKHPDERLAGC